MNYDEVVKQLTSLRKVPGVEYSLQSVQKVMQILSLSFDYPIIHVAGTNGKGSTCCKLKYIYTLAGYKTGCYTSPHLFSIRERIQINGENISKEDFVRLYKYITAVFEEHQMPKAFFGILTLMGLLHFKQQMVDIAIIEVGLGGRLDATNVIHPLLSIITSIQKDHMQILGNTLDEISFAKAGIIKPHTPVILAKTAQRQPVLHEAFMQQAPVVFLPEEEVHALHELMCKEAISLLMDRFPVDKSSIEKGIKQKPLCRLKEEEKDGVHLVLDVAHNEDSIAFLLRYLKQKFQNQKFRFVVGFSKDRDTSLFIKMIAAISEHIHLIDACHTKLIKKAEILSDLDPSIKNFISFCSDDKKEIKKALQLAKEKKEILVFTGTFYIFSFIHELLGLPHVHD